MDLNLILKSQREAYQEKPMPSLQERRQKLKTIEKILCSNKDSICMALAKDFGHRSFDESRIAEILPAVDLSKYCRKKLRKWSKPQSRPIPALYQPAKGKVIYQPLGVVGIIVPWNYPVYLAFGPLINAIAAGNRAMIKMSEFTPHSGELIAKLLKDSFAENEIAVINGGLEVSQAFSKLAFDHLFFTGSTKVGKLIMESASKNLCPVTLELGGKSPTIIHPSFDIKDAAKTIAFSKMFNAGQTCVAPDYILCPKSKTTEFIAEVKNSVKEHLDSLDSKDLTAIINDLQWQRLKTYYEQATAKGAQAENSHAISDPFANPQRKLPLILFNNPPQDSLLMEEEIFGPLMPVISYDKIEDALDFVNKRPRPLALYYFDSNKKRSQEILEKTHSGGVCVNECLQHVAQHTLPFGGIGPSGMGHYHGQEGFYTFSHAKAIMSRPSFFNSSRMIYPPYTGWIHKVINRFLLR